MKFETSSPVQQGCHTGAIAAGGAGQENLLIFEISYFFVFKSVVIKVINYGQPLK
jgi:hypothetical protein